MTPAIEAAHPTTTGDHDTYAQAIELVGNRHSKQSLVAMTNYHLVTIRQQQAEIERLRLILKQIASIEPWPDNEKGYVDLARAALEDRRE